MSYVCRPTVKEWKKNDELFKRSQKVGKTIKVLEKIQVDLDWRKRK